MISRKSFSIGLFEVPPRLDSGFALLAEMPREGHCVLPSTSYWSHMMSVCPTAGDVNFGHLVRVRSTRFARVKLLFPFTDNNCLVEWCFQFMSLMTPQTFSHRLRILG